MNNKKKSLAKNSLFNALYKILSVVYPLVTEAYIARILAPAEVGKVLFAYNIVNYFVLLAPLGLPTYGVKAVGAVQKNRNERDFVYSELFSINAISTCVAIAVYGFISILFHPADTKLSLIFSSLVIANIINVDWFYQGIEEYGFIAIRSFIVKFVCIVFIFTFVKRPHDSLVYASILSFAIIGNYFPNIVHIRKLASFRSQGLRIKRHIKPLMILFISSCATEIYTLLDSTMIGVIQGEQYLPYYTYASRLVRTVFSLLTAMSAVFLPRLSYYYKNKLTVEYKELLSYGIQATLFLAIPATIGVFLYSPQIIYVIFGDKYLSSITTLRILCPLIIIFSIAFINGHQVLISTNNENGVLKATIPGAILNFTLNSILIRYVGYNGAAIASVFAEILVTVILLYHANKVIRVNYYFVEIIKMILACLPLIPICFGINSISKNKYFVFIIGICLSVLAYFVCSYILKSKIMIEILKVINIRRKQKGKSNS